MRRSKLNWITFNIQYASIMAAATQFQPNPWLRRFRLCDYWSAEISATHLVIHTNSGIEKWPIHDCRVDIARGWFWSRALIRNGSRQKELHYLAHDAAAELVSGVHVAAEANKARLKREAAAEEERQALEAQRIATERQERRVKLQKAMSICCEHLIEAKKILQKTIDSDQYLAAHDRQKLVNQAKQQAPRLLEGNRLLAHPDSAELEAAQPLTQVVKYMSNFLQHHEQLLKERNNNYTEAEYARWRTFFDNCEERPLTEEQAYAAIVFEENTQLLAAAGSGKTSTIVGKVLYILAKKLAEPNDILCLAFNNKAANEIGIRIKQRLEAISAAESPINQDIKDNFKRLLESKKLVATRTFHATGKAVILEAEKRQKGRRISLEEESKKRFTLAITKCHENVDGFTAKWFLLQTVNRHPRPQESRFTTEAQYLEYLQGLWQQRKLLKSGKKGQKKEGILTLGWDEPVKSFEEAAISNWLYVMGVDFKYEEEFEEGNRLLKSPNGWKPDFNYKVCTLNGTLRIVHEHFALSENGHAPRFFKDPALYEKHAKNKKAVLAKLDERHFWTTSADYSEGTLFNHLQSKLQLAGIALAPRKKEQILERLKNIGLNEDVELLSRAVSQIRQNNWSFEHLQSLIPAQPEPARARLFIEVAWHVATALKQLLVNDGAIDFDEMINGALEHLKSSNKLQKYRVILVDEFQDTAPGRAELVRHLLNPADDSKLFAVGDDWQAINRFAGSDLSIFREFGEKFNRRPNANTTLRLSKTFRSNQGIADAARGFVLKNSSQLPKDVDALDKTRNGVIDVRFYQEHVGALDLVNSILQKWVEQHPKPKKPLVFLLGRYGTPRNAGLTKEQIQNIYTQWEGKIEFAQDEITKKPKPYFTIHQSKGLEADYVLILGLHSIEHDFLCFPSVREDDPLLKMVLPPKEAVEDADERRLFYVALTRAKRQAVLLAPNPHFSSYITELLLDHRDGLVYFNGTDELPPICAKCRKGLLVDRYSPKDQEHFLACSRRWECGATRSY